MAKREEKKKEPWTFKSWYERNKDQVAERRKSRYHDDDEYRERVLEQNRKYRKKMRDEAVESPKPRVRLPRHRRPVLCRVLLKGKPKVKQLVHVGTFARAIGKSVPTIHQWERLGLLPRTPFCVSGKSKQERLFTSEMIEVVKDVVDRRDRKISSKDPTFYNEVVDGWKKAGVILGKSTVIEEKIDG